MKEKTFFLKKGKFTLIFAESQEGSAGTGGKAGEEEDEEDEDEEEEEDDDGEGGGGGGRDEEEDMLALAEEMALRSGRLDPPSLSEDIAAITSRSRGEQEGGNKMLQVFAVK